MEFTERCEELVEPLAFPKCSTATRFLSKAAPRARVLGAIVVCTQGRTKAQQRPQGFLHRTAFASSVLNYEAVVEELIAYTAARNPPPSPLASIGCVSLRLRYFSTRCFDRMGEQRRFLYAGEHSS